MNILNPQFNASGTNSMLSIFTGAVDVAYMGSSPFILGHKFQLPIKIVAIANIHKGSLAIVGNKNSIKRLPNATKKIGTVYGSDGHVLAHEFKKKHLGDQDLTIVNLSPTEGIEALKLGMIDFVALWEPYVSFLLQRGFEKIFDDTNLNFRMYSFIVATEKSLNKKHNLISKFLDVHFAGLNILNSNIDEYLLKLRLLFGNDLSTKDYKNIIAKFYTWPKYNFLDSEIGKEDVKFSIKNIFDIHSELGNRSNASFEENNFFPSIANLNEGSENILNLGYSNSIMCTGFHLADLSGQISQNDFEIYSPTRRVEERIASLDEDYQEDLKLCFELLSRDPELVIQKIGRLNEQIFRNIEKLITNSTTKSFAGVLQKLGELNIIPSDILAWSDSIRSIRNVATHDEGKMNEEESKTTFNILLEILEWYKANKNKFSNNTICPRCHKNIDGDWIVCPHCGNDLCNKCQSCGKQIENNWKACPYCGAGV